MLTVVETAEYIRCIQKMLPEDSASALIAYLALNPKSGDVIEGTGGLRKLRWARPGMGKSGGARVIYYFYNETMPLFLLTAFAKNEKVDLSPMEQKKLKNLVDVLRASYGGKK